MFSTLPKTNIINLAYFILSSANALNLDQSRILSFGKALITENNPLPVFVQRSTLYRRASGISVSYVQDLRTGGPSFDLRLGQYSFR